MKEESDDGFNVWKCGSPWIWVNEERPSPVVLYVPFVLEGCPWHFRPTSCFQGLVSLLLCPLLLTNCLRLQSYQPYFGLSIVQIIVLILRFSGISQLSHILWVGTSLEVPSETSFCLPWHLKLHLVEVRCPERGKWPSLIQAWSEGLCELLLVVKEPE